MPIETAIMLSIPGNCIYIFKHGLSTLSVPTILAGHGHFSSRSNKIMSNERVPFRRSPVTGGGGGGESINETSKNIYRFIL